MTFKIEYKEAGPHCPASSILSQRDYRSTGCFVYEYKKALRLILGNRNYSTCFPEVKRLDLCSLPIHRLWYQKTKLDL